MPNPKPMTAARRKELWSKRGLLPKGSSAAILLSEALASDALRAEQIERLRVWITHAPLACYEHGDGRMEWCPGCVEAGVSAQQRDALLSSTDPSREDG